MKMFHKHKKQIFFIILIISISSIFLNFYQFNRIRDYQSAKGADYLTTARTLYHQLSNNYVDYWEKVVTEDESASNSLSFHLGKYERFKWQLNQGGGLVFSLLRNELSVLGRQLGKLDGQVKLGNDVKELKNSMETRRSFIIDTLTHIEAQLGEDTRKWYVQLSDFDSETSQWFWKRFKEYEEKMYLTQSRGD
ncbi:hypothetical protein GCM10008967_36970 [Bacillus carboniphilus]|uniref:Sporulation protein n=1 Tax=Bacillus carboniphilus TaxID=86663 RepID=A0ABN0WPF3_9BACI